MPAFSVGKIMNAKITSFTKASYNELSAIAKDFINNYTL